MCLPNYFLLCPLAFSPSFRHTLSLAHDSRSCLKRVIHQGASGGDYAAFIRTGHDTWNCFAGEQVAHNAPDDQALNGYALIMHHTKRRPRGGGAIS